MGRVVNGRSKVSSGLGNWLPPSASLAWIVGGASSLNTSSSLAPGQSMVTSPSLFSLTTPLELSKPMPRNSSELLIAPVLLR